MAKGTIRQRVRRLRAARGLSQREVARKGQISQALVTKIEDGTRRNPEKRTVEQLAIALGCTPEWLMFGVGDPPPILAA